MSVPYVKSSWTFCAVASSLAVALVLALALPAEARAKKKTRSIEELTNFLLGPERSLWLVGAISRIASEEEIDGYLRLKSDEDADAFIREFWDRRRSAESAWPAAQPQGIFEERARRADRLYGEGTRPGRRTDRGTIYVLYGPPEEVKFEVASRPGLGPIEVWFYPKKAEEGLDGERPRRSYYFVKKGEYTVETAGSQRQRLRPGRFNR